MLPWYAPGFRLLAVPRTLQFYAPSYRLLSAAGCVAGGLTLISRTTFTNAATTNVDNLFSDTYENYIVRLSYEMGTNGSSLRIRGRYGSTTVSSNSYSSAGEGFDGNFNAVNMYSNNVSSIQLREGSSSTNYCEFSVNRPGSSVRLYGGGFSVDLYNGGFIPFGYYINSSQAWSGLSIFADSGNVSGILTVYGMAKS